MSLGHRRASLVVLRALQLGDLLTAVPALRALRRAFPELPLVLAAPAGLAPLARCTGAVDDVVHTPSLDRLDPRLEHAALAVNLHGRGPQSTALLAAARPARLIAFGYGEDAPAWRPDEHEVARWCRLLEGSGIAADPRDLCLDPPPPPPPLAVPGASVIHPGAASPARRWPAERWAAVARSEAAAGRPVLVTGGPDEVGLAAEVGERAQLPPGAVLAGRTGLLDLVGLIAVAGRVVCGDTGVAHVATAVGTPSVVLFGPVPPAWWGPPPLPRHLALWAGRTGDPHGDVVDPGLLEIAVDDVLAALDRLPA